MTDYSRCLACGAVVKAEPFKWPICECREAEGRMYSHRLSDDFDSTTEEKFDEWVAEQEEE